MPKASQLVPVLFLAAAASCGPNNGTGFYVDGTLDNHVHATGGDAHLVFAFPNSTRVDPTLGAGQTSGTTGVCSIGPTGRSLRLTNLAGGAPDFQVDVTLPPWDQDTCTSCQHGQIVITQGSTVWTGVENRGGSGASQCTFSSTRQGSFDMNLTVSCTGLAASGGDARTIDVSGTLDLQQCDGPQSNGG